MHQRTAVVARLRSRRRRPSLRPRRAAARRADRPRDASLVRAPSHPPRPGRRARRRLARRREAAADRPGHVAAATVGARRSRALASRSTWCSPARWSAHVKRPKSWPRPSARIRPSINVDALAPGGTSPAIAAEIEKHCRRHRILIVGHEPGIGELAAWLIGMRNPIEFKKGGICRIDVDGSMPRGGGTSAGC